MKAGSKEKKDLNEDFPKQTDTFESKRGKLQLGPTGKTQLLPHKRQQHNFVQRKQILSVLLGGKHGYLLHHGTERIGSRPLGHYSMEGILWRQGWLEVFPVLPIIL